MSYSLAGDNAFLYILSLVFYICFCGLGLYIFIQTITDGTRGANQYGEDPKGREA